MMLEGDPLSLSVATVVAHCHLAEYDLFSIAACRRGDTLQGIPQCEWVKLCVRVVRKDALPDTIKDSATKLPWQRCVERVGKQSDRNETCRLDAQRVVQPGLRWDPWTASNGATELMIYL